MSPLIIVNGNSGTGKKTVSKFLEERLEDYSRFSPDDTRRMLGKTDYDPRDTHEVLSHMYGKISEKLNQGKGVIVHSHYKTSQGRQMIYDLASSHNSNALLIECVCPEDVAKKRMASRPKKDHLHSPPVDPKVYDRLKRIWEATDLDFTNNRNGHVGWMIYDSDKSTVREMKIGEGSRGFSAYVSELLRNQFTVPDRF